MTHYRGKHLPPPSNSAGKVAATVVTTGILASAPAALMPSVALAAAPPDIEAAIIECESGGDPKAENSLSSASGLYQFIDGTWRAYGGGEFSSRASGASAAEQRIVFQAAYAAEGTSPWNESKSCWSGKVGGASLPSFGEAPAAKKSEPKKSESKKSAKKQVADVRNPDGSGQYTCDQAHLHFDACDPHNLGEVAQYPLYKGKHRATTGGDYEVKSGDTLVKIAAKHGTSWQAIFDENRDKISNPDLIIAGMRLSV